jgi:galactokinase/mevalonate kinase-like predicted kinase
MIPLFERPEGYDPLIRQNITRAGVQKLAMTGRVCFEAILKKDIQGLGRSLKATHDAWRELLPLTTSPEIDEFLQAYEEQGFGAVTSGCGGGYILLVTDRDIPESIRIKVRRV